MGLLDSLPCGAGGSVNNDPVYTNCGAPKKNPLTAVARNTCRVRKSIRLRMEVALSPASCYGSVAAKASLVMRCRYANSFCSFRFTNHPAKKFPAAPMGKSYLMLSSSQQAAAPSGINRCVCSQRRNGPERWKSWNSHPSTYPRCSNSHRTRNGPMRTRNAPRAPSRIPAAASRISIRSQGGVNRWNAPGCACHAKTLSAGAPMRDRRTKVSLMLAESPLERKFTKNNYRTMKFAPRRPRGRASGRSSGNNHLKRTDFILLAPHCWGIECPLVVRRSNPRVPRDFVRRVWRDTGPRPPGAAIR